ncbi:uncharacterized protein LOC112049956 [Bicyclus anynana]|uniref:Uncharacterized protein LOC112049956 n=1 Tax=Bicyclus anynana TaxID=110368 RepID=A0ABM3LS43_BICAN|nr:uncharacterized protein LOC112049956 [Bicyclus anynana]
MQKRKTRDNSIDPKIFKSLVLSVIPQKKVDNETFVNGLQKARGLLSCLERSFEKSYHYEDKLLRCRSAHNHSHDSKDWCSSDRSSFGESGSYSKKEGLPNRRTGETLSLQVARIGAYTYFAHNFATPIGLNPLILRGDSSSAVSRICVDDDSIRQVGRYLMLLIFFTVKSKSSQTRSTTNVTESCSTMSITCLQFQYEELLKRYQALLKAYDERGYSLSNQDDAFHTLYERIKETYAELAHVNKFLIIIGEKYLNLKYKKLTQKLWYEERIERLKCAARSIFITAERARSDLDKQLSRCLASEQDTAMVLLLEKISLTSSSPSQIIATFLVLWTRAGADKIGSDRQDEWHKIRQCE